MEVPFLDLAWQHGVIAESLKKRFENIFSRSSFIGGPDVENFERHFADYLGVRHVVSVANGTDALLLALSAIGVGPGDEVITIPTTFVATASAIYHLGATPVFVDIDPDTRDFDFVALRKRIGPRTKAIIPVHLYGQPANIDEVLVIAQERGIRVVEDACQSHGATYKGRRIGSFGDLGCFSFYPGKNLGAYGDAGAVTTSDSALAEKIKMLRNHGGVLKYEHALVGYNSRLDALQAAVLDEKLIYLDEWNQMRVTIARMYDKELVDDPKIKIFRALLDTQPVYHLYVIQLLSGDRNDFIRFLKERGIGTGIHYPEPIHLLDSFRALGYREGDFPASEAYMRSIVSLPIYPGMTDEAVSYVIKAVKDYFR